MAEEKLLFSMIHGMWHSSCISVLLHLGVPEILCTSDKDSLSVDEIATKTGCSSSEQLYQVLRVLSQWGVGRELDNKKFTANRAMQLLRRDQGTSLGHMAEFRLADEKWMACTLLPTAVKTGEAAFRLAHGMDVREYCEGMGVRQTEKAFDVNRCNYSSLIGTPDRMAKMADSYNDAMLYMNFLHGGKDSGIFDIYPWDKCNHIMDVGGGKGEFLASILCQRGCEHVKGTLLELPQAIDTVGDTFTSRGINEDRIKLVKGDFLQPLPSDLQPDVVILKSIISTVTSDNLKTITTNIRQLLSEGGKLLIAQSAAPEACDNSYNETSKGYQPGFFALEVMASYDNGKIDTVGGWREYIERIVVPQGFRIKNVLQTNGILYLYELIAV